MLRAGYGFPLGEKGEVMPYITLSVTTRVIQQVNSGNQFQRQLAIQGASPELRTLIDDATGKNRVAISVCGIFKLLIGDTGAIWAAHQDDGIQADDFSDLYSLLSRRPDVPVKFQW
jgi:DNA-binding PucR family transcriptional regulator